MRILRSLALLFGCMLESTLSMGQVPVLQWAQELGGTGDDFGLSIAVDASGNIYSAGTFRNAVDFDPGPGIVTLTSFGGNDIFITKSDPSGNLLWARQIGGASTDGDVFISLDASGNVYLTGDFAGTSDFNPGAGIFNLTASAGLDIFVVNLDTNGNFVWAKKLGGSGNDYGQSVAIDASGNVLVSGTFNTTVDFDPGAGVFNLTSAGGFDAYVLKLSSLGNFLWADRMGGTVLEQANSLALDVSGNAYITGYFGGTADFDPGAGTFNLISAGGTDIFVTKLDANGSLIWAKQFGDFEDDNGNGISIDASGNVLTTGYFRDAPDFDPGAGTFTLTAAGLTEIFVSKLDANGNFMWAKRLGGTGHEIARSIAVDPSGNVYTTGGFYGAGDYDPGPGTFTMTPAGDVDVFISKLDANGNFVWAQQMPGGTGNQDFGVDIAVDASQNVNTIGFFMGTADFDPGNCTLNLASAGGFDTFVHKLTTAASPTCVPTITSFSPAAGQAGTPVVITGTNFSPVPANNLVKFNGVNATVVSSTSTSISTNVPAGASTGNITVMVGTLTATSGSPFVVPAVPPFTGVPGLDWARSVGSVTSDVGWSVTTDAIGNVYTTGEFSGTADFDPGAGIFNLTPAGGKDIFILKLDVNGNFLWARAMGGPGDDVGGSIRVDGAGNIYTTGQFTGTADFDPGAGTVSIASTGVTDIFISKLDVNGNFVWAKSVGGIEDDYGESIALDGSGNVYVTGTFRNTVDFDPAAAGTFPVASAGGYDIYILKLDGSGNFVWTKTMGDTGDEEGISMAIDASGNIHTTGYFSLTVDFDPGTGISTLTSAGLIDIYISKLDPNGNFIWARAMGGTNNDYASSIALDDSNNVYTTGGFSTSVDFDPGAGTFTLTSLQAYDVFISELDASGNFVLAKAFNGPDDNVGNSIAVDATGIYTIGKFISADFDPGAGVFNLSSGDGDNDIFVSRLDGSGNFAWAVRFGYINSDNGYSIALDNSGKILTTGFFDDSTDFDPSGCSTILTSVGNDDIFVQKINQSTLPPPTITSFTPVTGPAGTTVVITGTNFSPTAGNNSVTFNGVYAAVIASTGTTITTTVPTGATTGIISVTVGCSTALSEGFFTPSATCLPAAERAALIALYNSTNGATWNNSANWLSPDESTWFGITIAACHVTDINLPFNNMAGPIPAQIKDLTELQQLILHDNQLNGSIPAEIGLLSKLKTLTIQWNSFTGSIPPALGSLAQVITFDVCCNQLSGSIPKELGSMSQAQSFKIQLNQLSGNLPAELGNMTNIIIFDIGYNLLTGNVSNYPTAQQIFVRGNKISGLPAFTSSAVFQLQVQDNALTFEDLEPNISQVGFVYNPQANLPGGALDVAGGSTLTIPFSTGGTKNVYQWIKDGVAIPGATSAQYTKPNAQLADAGNYVVNVTNTLVTGLTLVSIPFVVTVTNQPPVISTISITAVVSGTVSVSLANQITDPNNNLDLSTLKIIQPPASGAVASIGPNATLLLEYKGTSFAGKDQVTIEVCDATGACTQSVISIEVAGEVIVYSGISPDGNGQNDKWIIQYIEALPDTKDNHVSLFNRWGDAVFETDNYDNINRVFTGLNKNGSELPTGTYFYKIEFASGKKTMTGYLSLKR